MQIPGESEAFVRALSIYSGLVNFELNDDTCKFYMESLRPHGLKAATEALIKLARDAKIGRGLPSVNEVIAIIAPAEVAKLDDNDEASLIAGQDLGRSRKVRINGVFVRF